MAEAEKRETPKKDRARGERRYCMQLYILSRLDKGEQRESFLNLAQANCRKYILSANRIKMATTKKRGK